MLGKKSLNVIFGVNKSLIKIKQDKNFWLLGFMVLCFLCLGAPEDSTGSGSVAPSQVLRSRDDATA